jgi:hypothetical protein
MLNRYSAGQEIWNIAEWLSSLNFKASQLEFLQKKQEGTGEWLLEDPTFKEWRDGILEALWCPGIREMISFNDIFASSPYTDRKTLGSWIWQDHSNVRFAFDAL